MLYTGTAEFILRERVEINHSYVNTLLNSIITLPEKYMLTQAQVDAFCIVDLQRELQDGRLQKLDGQDIYLPSTEDFNRLLVSQLKECLGVIGRETEGEAAQKEKNELTKATYAIATNAVSTYCQFYETRQSISVIIELLGLLFSLFDYKLDLAFDYRQLEETLKSLTSNKYDCIEHFEQIMTLIIGQVPKLPLKKQADVLKLIANRPGNFHFVSPDYYQDFIRKLLQFEENSMIYKDLLLSLSTLLAYVPLGSDGLAQLLVSSTKGQGVLLMAGYVMSTQQIGSEYVVRILQESSRERRNIFCKEMLVLRGKNEYLDDHKGYQQWREIKQYSNPYHYHA